MFWTWSKWQWTYYPMGLLEPQWRTYLGREWPVSWRPFPGVGRAMTSDRTVSSRNAETGQPSPESEDWPCWCGHLLSWHQHGTWCRFEDCSCRDYREAPPKEDT